MIKITLNKKAFFVSKESYTKNNMPAITLYVKTKDGLEPWIDLTTNIDSASLLLGEDEILVKTWSENESMIKPLLGCGLFEDTGRRVRCGFAEAHIWKMITVITGYENV
jgi:hypothetical protein